MSTDATVPSDLPGAFTYRSGRAAGLSAKQLRRRSLQTPFRGIRMQSDWDGAPDIDERFVSDLEQEVLRLASAYSAGMHDSCFFSHSTAAVLLGLPVPGFAIPRVSAEDPRPLIEVSTWHPSTAPRGTRIRGHQAHGGYARATEHDGMRVADGASVWASMGPRLGIEDLVALGDAVVRVPRIAGTDRTERPAHGGFDDLDELMCVKRRRGVVRLREARPLIRVGSASPPETKLRLLFQRTPGIPEPALDVDVRSPEGAFLGCSELAFPEERVAVEYESEYHRTDRDRWNRDIAKYERYAAHDWRTVRVTHEHLSTDPRIIIRRVLSALRRHQPPVEL